MVGFEEFKIWLQSQPSSVHGLVLKHASDGRCFTNFPAWWEDFKRDYDAIDWQQFVSSYGTIETPSPEYEAWKERALKDLDAFRDKTIWGATYLRCGSCYQMFLEWLSENPVDENWGEKAREIILEKKWL